MNPQACPTATSPGTTAMPPTLAPVSASVTAGPLRSGNHGSSAAAMPVVLRHAHPVPITASARNSCHGSRIQPSPATAAPMATAPYTMTGAGPRRWMAPLTSSRPSAPTR